jgi:hypothetical protein
MFNNGDGLFNIILIGEKKIFFFYRFLITYESSIRENSPSISHFYLAACTSNLFIFFSFVSDNLFVHSLCLYIYALLFFVLEQTNLLRALWFSLCFFILLIYICTHRILL